MKSYRQFKNDLEDFEEEVKESYYSIVESLIRIEKIERKEANKIYKNVLSRYKEYLFRRNFLNKLDEIITAEIIKNRSFK